jgi:hypothetical protein
MDDHFLDAFFTGFSQTDCAHLFEESSEALAGMSEERVREFQSAPSILNMKSELRFYFLLILYEKRLGLFSRFWGWSGSLNLNLFFSSFFRFEAPHPQF